MIRSLEEFGKYVAMTGLRNAEIEDLNNVLDFVRKKTANVDIQFFDASLIAGWKHLYFATLNALKAFESKLNISNSVAMETLLYASAQRQISKAIDLIGIKPYSSQIAVLIVARTHKEAESALEIVSKLVSGERDDDILELNDDKTKRIRKLFDISDLELESKLKRKGLEREALVDLVIEHGALLVTKR